MSHSITESDTYTSAIPTPDITDTTYPSTVTSAITGLANRTNYLANALNHTTDSLDNTTTGVFAPSVFTIPDSARASVIYNFGYQIVSAWRFVRRSVWGATESPSFMYVAIVPTVESDGVGFQVPGSSTFLGSPMFNSWVTSSRIFWYQNGTPSGVPALFWPIRGLPPAGKIVSFSMRLKGAAGHSGLPATMPTISLYKQVYGNSGTLLATVADTSANTTQYQLEHDLNMTDLSISIDPSTSYYFKFTGESGTNKLTGLQLLDCLISIWF